MAFFKDRLGRALFITTYVAIFIQFLTVFIIQDNDKDSSLIYHKFYFYFLIVMSIWCHIKCAITEPGMITIENNQKVIEFYLNIHELGIKRAEKFNQTYGEVFFKNMGEDEEIKDDDDEDYSDYDEDTQYAPTTSVTDELMEEISNNYQVELKRCAQCHVVRPPRGHHCTICKGCVMKMDHHCPWINNCIGQFTQKFFIQFCSYALAGSCEDLLICCYYLFYKNKPYFLSRWSIIFLVVFQIIVTLLYGLFTICMINEQWNIIQNDTTMMDLKKKKFTEKRDFNEVINETFGRGFDFSWLFPIKTGGFFPFFNKVVRGKKRN